MYYPAERALHRTSARATSPHGFWTLPGYVFFHLRQFALMVGVPVGLCVVQQGLVRLAPELVQTNWFQFASVAACVGLFVLLPRVVKPALGLQLANVPGLIAVGKRTTVRVTVRNRGNGPARSVIFLFMGGGPSQVDTFDPKPLLQRLNGQDVPESIGRGVPRIARSPLNNLFASPYRFRQWGQSGIPVAEIFPNLGRVVDKLCILRSCRHDSPIHAPA